MALHSEWRTFWAAWIDLPVELMRVESYAIIRWNDIGRAVAAHLNPNRNAASLARELAAQMLSNTCPKTPAQAKKGVSRS
jgi:hypothetical protein